MRILLISVLLFSVFAQANAKPSTLNLRQQFESYIEHADKTELGRSWGLEDAVWVAPVMALLEKHGYNNPCKEKVTIIRMMMLENMVIAKDLRKNRLNIILDKHYYPIELKCS